MRQLKINPRQFRVAFLLLLVAAVSALFLSVVSPFLQALMYAAIFSGLCQPLFQLLLRLCPQRRTLAALMTVGIFLGLLVGPVSGVLALVANQAVEVNQEMGSWLQKNAESVGHFDARSWLVERFPGFANVIPSRKDLSEQLTAAGKALSAAAMAGASAFTKGAAGFLLNAFVMFYAMFYFLKDGRKILETIFYYMPLSHEDEILMLERLASVTRATVKGTLLIALIQGTLAGLAFFVAGISGSLFWGALMVMMAVIPGFGTTIVWVPATVYLYLSGQHLSAVLLALWCVCVVGVIDNILRPRLVGQDAKMPDLMILIGTLGGIFYFGPLGFISGPIICGLFLTVWEIYGAAFSQALPPVKSLRNFKVPKPKAKEPKAAESNSE